MSNSTITVSCAALAETVAQVADSLLSCSLRGATQMLGQEAIDTAISCAYALELSHVSGSFTIITCCHPSDAQRLASQMTGKSGQSLTPQLIKDAMSEWLNIIAGQIKSLAGLDHSMGLPHVLNLRASTGPSGFTESVGLRVDLGEIEVVLWLGLVGGPNVTVVLGD